jgi:large subunit ribosomal protein L21
MIVHEPTLPITLPPKEEETFAVVVVSGSQHKVMKDDLLLANYLEGYDINDQIVFDGVLMVGSKEFTLLGRPHVTCAKVYATVEEQTELEKTIVFKKRRRKSYQKTMHYPHKITVLRINKIDLNVTESLISRAVAL